MALINTIQIPTIVKYSQYGTSVSNIPITTPDTMTPTPGSHTTAPDVWEETKYIIYKNKADPPGIDSPYKNSAATIPYFEINDMTYTDTVTANTHTNIRDTCPISYTLDGTTYTKSKVSGKDGYDGVYRLTLASGEETEGTYEVTVTGTDITNTLTFTIKFVLNLKDFCKEMGTTNSKLLGTPILSTVKYS